MEKCRSFHYLSARRRKFAPKTISSTPPSESATQQLRNLPSEICLLIIEHLDVKSAWNLASSTRLFREVFISYHQSICEHQLKLLAPLFNHDYDELMLCFPQRLNRKAVDYSDYVNTTKHSIAVEEALYAVGVLKLYFVHGAELSLPQRADSDPPFGQPTAIMTERTMVCIAQEWVYRKVKSIKFWNDELLLPLAEAPANTYSRRHDAPYSLGYAYWFLMQNHKYNMGSNRKCQCVHDAMNTLFMRKFSELVKMRSRTFGGNFSSLFLTNSDPRGVLELLMDRYVIRKGCKCKTLDLSDIDGMNVWNLGDGYRYKALLPIANNKTAQDRADQVFDSLTEKVVEFKRLHGKDKYYR